MATDPLVRRGRRLFAGEAAGFQDALFGFGMRYALTSGHLAGAAWASGDLSRYEDAYRRRLRPGIRAALVNRYLYERGGAAGYRALVRRVCGAASPRAWLGTHYGPRWWTPLAYPLARRAARLRAHASHECRDECDCTYCRCTREATTSDRDSHQPKETQP